MIRLMEVLEDHDDVQNVHSTLILIRIAGGSGLA